MFRNHPKTDAFDIKRIEQHVAAIKFLSDALKSSNERDLLSSHLTIMMNAINSFEKHRFSDYQFNKTKRAEQVLHTRNIFNALYKDRMKQTNASILAHALKHELKDYVTSVEGFVAEVQHHLAKSVISKYESAENEMEWALLDSEIRQTEIKYNANYLAELAKEAGVTPATNSEDDIDYLIQNAYDEKSYLFGTMPSDSDEEYSQEAESYSSYSDDDYDPESDSDIFYSDDDSSARNYSDNSPLLSHNKFRIEWLRNSRSETESVSDDDNDYDYTPRCR